MCLLNLLHCIAQLFCKERQGSTNCIGCKACHCYVCECTFLLICQPATCKYSNPPLCPEIKSCEQQSNALAHY